MLKVLYVPLDERPCNATYPVKAATVAADIEIVDLPLTLMGRKKQAGNVEAIWAFVHENIEAVDYAVFSTEMLLYGGLLPSRLHHLTEKELAEYEQRLRQIKKTYPEKKLYFSNLIMRTPRYNSSDEEPDYYAEFGAAIFRYGYLKDKQAREPISKDEEQEFTSLKEQIPQEFIQDYESRRQFNLEVNLLNIRLVQEGVIDFLSIPQDDSAPYGYTAIDQKSVYSEIAEHSLKSKIMVYPGADEVGFTLLARAYNEWKGTQPSLFVYYSSTLGPTITPMYEDRIMNESLKAHVMVAGFKLTETLETADFILGYNTPGLQMQESWDQFEKKDITYDTQRHLLTFVAQLKEAINTGRKVGICDSAFANGGEVELLQLLDQNKLLEAILVYKGWNTNCNTLGSGIASLAFCQDSYDRKKLINNLLSNIFEDIFYQAKIRMEVTAEKLPDRGLNYFDLKNQAAEVSHVVKSEMRQLRKQYLIHSFLNQKLMIETLDFPWNRMFEINCQIKLNK